MKGKQVNLKPCYKPGTTLKQQRDKVFSEYAEIIRADTWQEQIEELLDFAQTIKGYMDMLDINLQVADISVNVPNWQDLLTRVFKKTIFNPNEPEINHSLTILYTITINCFHTVIYEHDRANENYRKELTHRFLKQHEEKLAQKSYRAIHDTEGEWFSDDIRTVDPTNELPEFDVLCGGFPCQSFSVAGKQGGFEDTRGTLFFEIARIAKERKPKYLFLENVRGLLSHNGGKTFGTILNSLHDLGYSVE